MGYRFIGHSAWFFLLMMVLTGFTFSPSVSGIHIEIDYSYDTGNFFGSGNPQGAGAGAQAKAALEAAANYYSGILNDSLSAISTPAPYTSETWDGTVTWSWSMLFFNPATGNEKLLYDETIAENEFRIYAGARNLGNSTLGLGGPGVGGPSWDSTGRFTTAEFNEVSDIRDAFVDTVTTRGEADGFSSWGGSVAFNRSSNTNWHFDHTTAPGQQQVDFYSTALHELAHTLGFGVSSEWEDALIGSSFTGQNAVNEYGGWIPLDCNNDVCGHWQEGTQSTILGTSVGQETAFDPELYAGHRKLVTALDAAALEDIGWEVAAPTIDLADFNFDGRVDGGDLAVWERNFGVSGLASADGDNDTDGADFLIWQRRYGNGNQAFKTVQTIPEPASAMLLLVGISTLSTQRYARG